jgi:ferredoxin
MAEELAFLTSPNPLLRKEREKIHFMITVDKETCIGCGSCVALCPDVFQLDANGKAEVISSAPANASADKQNNIECAKNAAESCPVQVIKVNYK